MHVEGLMKGETNKCQRNRRDNKKLTIQRNLQHRAHKTKKNNKGTICVEHHCMQANTNNVNKMCVLLQTAGGKDEPNIVFIHVKGVIKGEVIYTRYKGDKSNHLT